MKAVVLVGGEGTRLRPLTYRTPKQLLPVAECTVIERVVGHLAGHGIDHVVLSMGYQPDAFIDAFPDDRCAGLTIEYAVEPEPLDTAGGIAFAARHAGLDRAGQPFVVVNGDVLTDLDVSALVDFHRRCRAEATIALTPVDDPSSFGVVPTDDEGRVLEFIEKPEAGTEPTNMINAGFYVLEPSVLDRIPVGERVNIERVTFPQLVDAGTLYALGSEAYWTDTGTPELFLGANLDLLGSLRPAPPAPGAREADPDVWVLGASVIEGTVEPPVLIGDAVYIDRRATVDYSVIGAGARIEGDARVSQSAILPGAVVRAGAVVEASVVGDGAVIGAGAQLRKLAVVQGGLEVPAGAVLDGERWGQDREG